MTRQFRIMFGAALSLMLVACGQSGVYFEQSPEQISSALHSTTPPLALLGESIKRARVYDEGGNIITAFSDSRGKELLHIVTTVSPEGEGARVSSTLLVNPEFNSGLVNPGLVQQMADEHVASAIEGRVFDVTFAAPGLAKAALSRIPGGSERLEAINEGVAFGTEMRQMIDEAEREMEFREEYGDDWGFDPSE